jgi:adenylate cyclase
MLAITQFEVYVLQQGRWILHARYPGEERQQAVLDARTTEAATGFPAKVIRETYFPEVNDSERITTYISPKAKEQTAALARKRTPLVAARAAASAASAVFTRRRARPAAPKPRLTAGQIFFRVIVAGGISLACASLMTGIIAWVLHTVSEAGVLIAPNLRSTLLTYSYVLMFLFFFWSLFRSRLPLHRLLADLWQKASKPAVAANAVVRAGKPPRVKPKHDSTTSPEALRELEDLKVKRGDIDPTKPAEIEEVPVAIVAAEPVPPPLPPEPKKDQPEAAKPERKPEPVAIEPPPVLEPATPEPKVKAKPALAEDEGDALDLERMVIRRFAADVVKPAARTMPDDPVARRGAALVLAGGATGVAATAKLNASAEQELLMDALRHVGLNQAGIDSFMSQHTQQVSAPANAPLLAAGRAALTAYLEGASDVAATLARALASWRTPFGQTTLDEPVSSAVSANVIPLLEIYVLTELREDRAPQADETSADALHDHAMGTHNGVVRNAVAAHGGQEVKHTGKGIFARFTTVLAAVDAAMDMQRQFQEPDSKLAIGIIGNTAAHEDPLLSSNLIRQAQAVVSRTGAGEILCESRVQAALKRSRGKKPGAPDESEGAEELGLVRLAVPESDFVGFENNRSGNTAAK